MSKICRYTLSFLTVIVLMFALCITAYAAETGECTDTITWILDDNGVLCFSGEGDIPDYESSYKTPWAAHQNSVKKLVFEEGITSIGERAFSGYKYLEEIVIEGEMTHIGYEAFFEASFKSLEINNVKEIGERAFCRNLSLKTLAIGEGVEILSDQAFSYCTALSDVSLSEGLKEMKYYSFYSSKITEITIPKSVELVGKEAFYYCEKLESVTFLGGTDEIGSGAFGRCSALKNVVLPEGVKKIGDLAFNGCTSLKEIFVPCSVYSIAARTFYATTNLNYPVNTVVKGYTGSIAEYIANQYGEEYFFTFESIGEAPDMELFTGKWGDTLTWTIATNGILTIGGKGIAPEESSAPWAYYRGYIKKIIIEDNVNMITSWQADKHPNLVEIDTGSGLVKFDGMSYLPNLEKVYGYENSCVHKAIPSDVEFISKGEIEERIITGGDINNINWTLTNLGKITISGEGEMEAFTNAADCPWYPYRKAITSLEVCEGVTRIDSDVYWDIYYPEIKEARIHHSVLDFSTTALCDDVTLYAYKYSSAGDSAERNNLEYISLGIAPKRVLATGSAGENITWEYDNHRNMKITGSGDMDQSAIRWDSYMEYAEDVEISEGITSIAGYAFEDSRITSLVIPNTVTYIAGYAFKNCDNLKEITLPYSLLGISNSAFSGVSFDTIKGYEGSFAEMYAKYRNKEFVSLGEVPEKVEVTYTLNDTISCTVDNYGTLTVSGVGEMPDYIDGSKNPPWQKNLYWGVNRIVIGEGITRVGNYSFCTIGNYIEEINLPSTLETIGNYAFSYCNLVEEVTIPEGVWCIGKNAFALCTNFKKVNIPASVVIIQSYAFRNCPDLTVYGYDSTASERYAQKAGIDFVCKGKVEDMTVAGATYSTGISWKIDNFGTLTFYGEGAMPDLAEGTYQVWYNEYKSNVTAIVFEEGITHLGENAVSYTNVKTIKLPDSVTSVSSWAIYMNNELETLWLSAGMSEIADDAFVSNGIKRVYIPSSIKKIGEGSFDDTWLSDVYYGGQASYWVTSVEGKENLYNAMVHYTDGMNAVISTVQSTQGVVVEVSENLTEDQRAYIAGYKDEVMVVIVSVEGSGSYLVEEDVDSIKVFFWEFNGGYEPIASIYEKDF